MPTFTYSFSLAEYVAKIRSKLPKEFRETLNELETILQLRDDDTEEYLNTDTATNRLLSGSGTPEGNVTASVGYLYLRTDGGASTTLYVKESGTGNTGWVAK